MQINTTKWYTHNRKIINNEHSEDGGLNLVCELNYFITISFEGPMVQRVMKSHLPISTLCFEKVKPRQGK